MAIAFPPSARPHLDRLQRTWTEREGVVGWLTTTNHKRIGML